MNKRDIFSYFRVGGTTEAINSTVNEFIDCYQLITCSGHSKASKKSSGVLLCGGCMVAPLSSRPNADALLGIYVTLHAQLPCYYVTLYVIYFMRLLKNRRTDLLQIYVDVPSMDFYQVC